VFRRHASCSAANTITCDGTGAIADIEVRPEGIALYRGEHPDAIVHTNHYMTEEYRQYEDRRLPDSFPRFDRMSELVRQHWGQITVDHLKGFLADHQNAPGSICRHGLTNMHTTSGHIAEPERGLLHIRRGHGCTGVWETFEL
jgi:isopenicillin-N N-acyltransferase like protein